MDYKDRGWLFQKFCVELLSDSQIGELCQISKEKIRYWRQMHSITKKDKQRKCRFCDSRDLKLKSGLICNVCHYNKYHQAFLEKPIEERRECQRKYNKAYKEKLVNASVNIQMHSWCRRHSTQKNLSIECLLSLGRKAIIDFPYITFSPYITDDRSNQASVDKIDPRGGYVFDNIRIIPYWLNAAKQKMNEKDLIEKMRHYLLISELAT